jgi:hypothetical protein
MRSATNIRTGLTAGEIKQAFRDNLCFGPTSSPLQDSRHNSIEQSSRKQRLWITKPIGLVGLILANWQERRALQALRERCPELLTSISGVMAVLVALVGVLALIGALLR